MNKHEQVIRCNNALRREFGEDNGFPRFKWFHSEDKALMISMRQIDPENGQPVYDYRQDPHTLIVQPMPVFIRRKICLKLHNQFVRCKVIPTYSQQECQAGVGRRPQFTRRGKRGGG